MHEQAETIQLPSGRWANVYGRATPRAGQRLDSLDFGTVEEAVTAAKARSAASDEPPPGFVLDRTPPPGFVLDGEPSPAPPARIGPVQEPTFAEKYVAPSLEAIGSTITKAIPFMPQPVGEAVKLASNPAPIVQAWADPWIGIAQTAFEALGQGDKVTPAIQAQEARYQQSRGADAGTFDPIRTAASVLNPLPIKGAAAVKPAATIGKRILQGAGIGGAGAASQPVYGEDFWGDKGRQAATGAALGGSLPLIADIILKTLRAGYHVIEPRLSGGLDMIVGRTANKAAGDRQEAVVQALEDAKQFVPGSHPTAGEAAVPAGSAEFAGLQRVTEGRDPSGYLARDAEQAGARRASIREFGKDKAALEKARAERSANAAKNYEAAYATDLKADPELAQIAQNPYFKDALPEAVKLHKAEQAKVKAAGGAPKEVKDDVTRFLHFVKLAMDGKIGATGKDALDRTQREAVAGAKDQLVAWLGKKNPAYDKARTAFAADSAPINQMEVGQALEKKLESSLTTEGGAASKAQRAELFAGAVREAPSTVKKATGPRFAELEEALTPDQVEKVRGVVKDMARSADYEEMGKRGAEAARRLIGETLDPKQIPPMLHRPTMLANAALRRIQGSAEGKTLDLVAKKMQDPKEMARIMRAASAQEREGILTSLFGAIEASASPIAAVGGAATGKTASGEAPDAPRDKKQREVGRVYRTPQGPKEWSENGWLTLKK